MWDLYFPFPSSLTTSPFLSSGDFTLKACLHSVCAVFGLCHSEFSLDYHALSPGSCDSLLTSSLVSNYVFFFFFFGCFLCMKCSSSIISQRWPSLLSDIPGTVPSCRALFIICSKRSFLPPLPCWPQGFSLQSLLLFLIALTIMAFSCLLG